MRKTDFKNRFFTDPFDPFDTINYLYNLQKCKISFRNVLSMLLYHKV